MARVSRQARTSRDLHARHLTSIPKSITLWIARSLLRCIESQPVAGVSPPAHRFQLSPMPSAMLLPAFASPPISSIIFGVIQIERRAKGQEAVSEGERELGESKESVKLGVEEYRQA